MSPTARVRINAEGLNRARLLGTLGKEDIEIRDFLQEDGRKFAFSVRKKDMRKTFAILDELCYTYSAEQISGVRPTLGKLLSRIGFIVGVAVFSVLLSLSRGYVWRIEITGNDNIPDKVIQNALSAQNIAVGKPLSYFDSDKLSAAVRTIDGINLASCSLNGTTVSVEVFESETVAPPLEYSDVDILSRYDATVTRVITREGTALVEVGQNVFCDTPLIGAYRVAEEGAEPIKTRASGIVYGRVAYTKSIVTATEWYEDVPEKVTRRTRLSIFGLTIGKKLPIEAGCTVVESQRKLDVFLPITVKTAHITYNSRRKMTADIETLAAKAEDETVLSFISQNAPSAIKSSRTVRELGGGLYRVNVFIEAEIVIS